jgi:hypothetical protein
MKKYLYATLLAIQLPSVAHAGWNYQHLVSCLLRDECSNYVPTQGKQIDNGAEPWFYPVQGTNFGSVLTIKSSTQQFIASNIGTGDLTVYGFNIQKAGTPFQYTKSDCPLDGSFVLKPGAACTVNVKFAPQKAGSFDNTLTLLHSSTLVPAVEKYIEGVGLAPTPEQLQQEKDNLTAGKDGTLPSSDVPVSPVTVEDVKKGLRTSTSGLKFGAVPKDATVASQSVQIFNDTEVPVHPFEVMSSSPDFLSSSHNCFPSIPAKGSCTLTVSLNTSKITNPALNAIYKISTSEAVNASIGVTGEVQGPNVIGMPNPLEILSTSTSSETAQPLTLSNVGNGPAVLSGISVSDQTSVSGMMSGASFSQKTRIINNGCGATLAAKSTCEILLGYGSASEGSDLGSISYTVNGVKSVIPVKAKMVLPELSITDDGYDFQNVDMGQTKAKVFTVQNVGDKSVSINDIVSESQFVRIEANQCKTSLAVGDSCQFTALFKGDVLNQSKRKHTISIPNNGDVPSTNIAVTGASVGGYLEPSATSYSYGKVEYSTESYPTTVFTFTNTGNRAITGLTSSIDSAQFVVNTSAANRCANKTTLNPSEQCVEEIGINASLPTSGQEAVGTLKITGSAYNLVPSLDIALKGEVVGGILRATPSNILFGEVAYGSKQERLVTVSNTGVKAVTLGGVDIYGSKAMDYTENNCTPGKVLEPKGTCTFKVIMATVPDAKDGAYITLGVKSDAAKGVTGVSASGITKGAWIDMASAITLSDSKAGVLNRKTVVVNNLGYSPLIIKNVRFNNTTNGTWTSVGTGCTANGSDKCELSFDVNPLTYGQTTAQLVFDTNDSRFPTFTANISGSAYAGGGTLYIADKIANSYDFGTLKFGESKTVSGKIVNHGEQAITITGLGASGWTVSGCLGSTLNPNTSCVFSLATTMGITSNPDVQVKQLTATFTNATPRSVDLRVKPEGASAALSNTTYNFGDQVYQVQRNYSFTITNEGVSPMTLGAWSVDANSEFEISDNCGTALAPQATCTATVKFAPKLQGLRSYVFERSSSSAGVFNGKIQFTAKGTGLVAKPVALATISGATGGKFTVPLAIVNKGTAGMVIQSISAVNGNMYSATITNPANCAAIASASSCNYQLTYTKPADGTAPLKLKLIYTGGPSPLEVDITASDADIADSCSAIKAKYPSATNGSYLLNKQGTIAPVYCDQETDGGGWELAYVNSYELATANPSFPLKHMPYKAFAKGQAIITGSAIPGMPSLPSGYINDFNRVLIKGGTSAWQAVAGPWASFDTLTYTAPTMSSVYPNGKTAAGGTKMASGAVGWGATTVNSEDPISFTNLYTSGPTCGGAGWGVGKNCMAMSTVGSFLDNYPYHYEVRSYREIYFRK